MNTAALRTLLIYAIILPLAVFIGWIVAGDMTRSSFAVLSAVAFVLLLPVLLKWHYPVLLFTWNTFITVFFLPGKPALWMIMAGVNFAMGILQRILLKRPAFLSAPSVTISLLVLSAIVALTAVVRGGIGVQALGGETIGGKGYYLIFAGVIGYFALTSQPIPPDRAKLYVSLFFLAGLVTAGSNLIYYAGEPFYILFAIFPVEFAAVQAASDYGGMISRIAGFGVGATFGLFLLLALSGVRRVLSSPRRLAIVVALLPIAAMGGYRSTLILIGLTVVILFVHEGLLKTPIFPKVLLVVGLGFVLLIPVTRVLPLAAQRSLSFIPGLPIDPVVKQNAQNSTEWRRNMWRAMWPDLPKYLWIGKGYVMNPTDAYLTMEAQRRYRVANYQSALQAGNYHSGPLSVYVPFGSFGTLAFLAFLIASLRVLYLNSKYGREDLRTINRFLFACFLARAIFFMTIFGAFSVEAYIFTGMIGLSVALNHGVCRKPAPVLPQAVRFRRNFAAGGAQPRPA